MRVEEKPFADRTRLREIKRDAVLKAAVQLFLEVGYHKATLVDVARRLGITKPALYNYFANKEEILYDCFRIGEERIRAAMVEVDEQGGTGAQKLRRMITLYAKIMMSDFGRSLVMLDDRELDRAARKKVRSGKRKIDAAFRRWLQDGVDDGSIAVGNVKLAAFTIAGALSWIGQWYMEDGALSADEIADEMATRLIEGVATRRRR